MDFGAIYQQVRNEFTCDHPLVVLTRYMKVNNTSEFRKQCTRCGTSVEVVRKASIAIADLDHIPLFDKSLPEDWQKQCNARYEELKAAAESDRSGQWQEWYASYLRSPRWALKRGLVLERSRGKCEGCGKARAFEVHHLTYQHVGDEFLFELVAICEQCHRRLHGQQEAG